jgi:MerR family transcriptional regulator, copper efflux regulator
MSVAALMTTGELAARTGLSHKQIRELEGRGLIYSVGRSDGNYRLFDESALWCVRTIVELRELGLTLTEIERLRDHHRPGSELPLEQLFRAILNTVRARLVDQIEDLNATVARIDAFRASIPGHFAVNGIPADPCLPHPHWPSYPRWSSARAVAGATYVVPRRKCLVLSSRAAPAHVPRGSGSGY